MLTMRHLEARSQPDTRPSVALLVDPLNRATRHVSRLLCPVPRVQ